MTSNNNYSLPDEEFEGAAKEENYPDKDLRKDEDDRDIDIDVKHSEELPDGDDVDLERAE